MIERCAHCPARADHPCRGGIFCAWAMAGDPVHLRHIAAVAAGTASRPVPMADASPRSDPTPVPATPDPRLVLVAACPHRGGVLPHALQPEGCGCRGELSECRAGKGKVSGRVTLRDCLACVAG